MKIVSAGVLAAVLLSADVARADSFGIEGAFSTGGIFTCRPTLACSGTGTNSVNLGSGSNTATLTFHGVESTVLITNVATPVTLGHFEVTSSPGFTFPTRPNPNVAILNFNFTIHHTTPTDDTNTFRWTFGPGGKPYLQMLEGQSYTSFPLFESSPGHNYDRFIYSFNSLPLRISGSGITDLTANVGAIPEPATMLLVGGGLAGAIARRRRKVAA
jgi:PEP-CTERM motif